MVPQLPEKVPRIFETVKEHLKRMDLGRICRKLSDPRDSRYREWSLEYLLHVLVVGMLSGCKNLRAVEDLSEIYDKRIPDTTLYDVLVRIDPEPLREVVVEGVKEALRAHELPKDDFPVRITAIDGKSISVSGAAVGQFSQPISGGGEGTYRNMALRAFHVSNDTKLFLGQREIHGKTGEALELGPFIDTLVEDYGNTSLLEVISVDAGMTSKANADHIRIDKGLHYIMALKGPQQVLFEAANDLLMNVELRKRSVELHNGNQVTRELYRISLPNGHYTWPHLREMWRVKQVVVDATGKSTCEERFFLSSLDPETLTHAQVLEAVRMHWGVENNGFWTLDTAWQEDDAPWTNNALVFISQLRLIAYNIVSRLLNRRLRSAKARAISWAGILKMIEHACCQLKSFFVVKPSEYTTTLA